MQRGRWSVEGVQTVDTRRSYYLAYRQDDFAEAPASSSKAHSYEILYAAAANDNSPNKPSLSARRGHLFRHLFAMLRSVG
jgi:hypothetical protein